MTDADRTQEADRLMTEASYADAAGREEEAVELYRRAGLLGEKDAQSNLGVVLTNRGGRWHKPGLRWLKRSAYGGNGTAAWNLAMQHRIGANRAAYLRWMRVAARLGCATAVTVLSDIERRRAAREPWSMLKGAWVDQDDVVWVLEDFREGTVTAAYVTDWAQGVVRKRDVVGVDPQDHVRLLPVVWEMASPGLTPQRAAELIFKLS